MSSLDNFPDWSAFEERDVPFMVNILSPTAEIATLLQRHSNDLQAASQASEQVQDLNISNMVQQANYIFRLQETLQRTEKQFKKHSLPKVYQTLRIIKNQMLEHLQQAGFSLENPVGQPFATVSDQVEVTGWLHQSDIHDEIVLEVREPIITYQGRLVQHGQVIMGAPLQETQEEEDPPASV